MANIVYQKKEYVSVAAILECGHSFMVPAVPGTDQKLYVFGGKHVCPQCKKEKALVMFSDAEPTVGWIRWELPGIIGVTTVVVDMTEKIVRYGCKVSAHVIKTGTRTDFDEMWGFSSFEEIVEMMEGISDPHAYFVHLCGQELR